MREITITDMRVVPGDAAFLIDDGETAILYDTGFGFTGNSLSENVRKRLGTRPLDYILLTHSHYDHALGSAYLTRDYPNAKVVAGEYAARIFQKPSARAVMRDLDRKAAGGYGITAYEDRIDALRVDIPVRDGDSLLCGSLKLTVVALPGHTRCSVGYYLREQKLLLGTETLGVYFGENTYLPSYLVGYQMAMDSFEKAKGLELERILSPHYGVVDSGSYLVDSQRIARETADVILSLYRAGKSTEEIVDYFMETVYTDRVAPTYPIDAFRLNTGIMAQLVKKERMGG